MQPVLEEAEWDSVGSQVPRDKEELKSTGGGDVGPVDLYRWICFPKSLTELEEGLQILKAC